MAQAKTRMKASSPRGRTSAHAMLPGFTIIEVVLVLAVGGLIMMMVFIALPGLQASQRDTQRKQDLSRLETAITKYQSNNNGKLPTAVGTDFVSRYLEGNFVDPGTDGNYSVTVVSYSAPTGSGANPNLDTTLGNIKMVKGARCTGREDTLVESFGGSVNRYYALTMQLENGVYCIDNG